MGSTKAYAHGSLSGYTKMKCRCAECRRAWCDYQIAWKARKKAKEAPGYVAPDVSHLAMGKYEHGTRSAYVHAKCRCQPCVEVNRSYFADWRERNPGRFADYLAAWNRAHPGKKRAQTVASYLRHRDRYLTRAKTYRKSWLATPNGRARDRAKMARYRQRRRVTMDRVDRLLSASYRLAIADDPCTYCGGPGEQDDHVFPLALGGTDHWWNLTRACARCNQSKGMKLLGEWKGYQQSTCTTASAAPVPTETMSTVTYPPSGMLAPELNPVDLPEVFCPDGIDGLFAVVL